MRQEGDHHGGADQLVEGAAPAADGTLQIAREAFEQRRDGGDGDGEADHQAPDGGGFQG